MASEQRGKPKMRSHTIFLIQTSDDLEARQYADFPTITAAMDGTSSHPTPPPFA